MAGSVVEVSDSNFESDVLQSDTPVLVDFWAPWCGPCRMLGPVVEAVAAQIGPALKVVKLNVDDSMGTATNYRVQSIPTLIWFKDGQVADKHVGFIDEAALRAKCQAVIG